jgi:iron complex outermembrane receptor protein
MSPCLRNLEIQLAARIDHYSDFGGTTNPKIAARLARRHATCCCAAHGEHWFFHVPTLIENCTARRRFNYSDSLDDHDPVHQWTSTPRTAAGAVVLPILQG